MAPTAHIYDTHQRLRSSALFAHCEGGITTAVHELLVLIKDLFTLSVYKSKSGSMSMLTVE